MKKFLTKSLIAGVTAVMLMAPCAAITASAAAPVDATSAQIQEAKANGWDDGGYLSTDIVKVSKIYSTTNNAGKRLNVSFSYNYSEFSKLNKNGKAVTGLQVMAYNFDTHTWDSVSTVVNGKSNTGTIGGGYITLSSSVKAKSCLGVNISHLGADYKQDGIMVFALCPVVYSGNRMSFLSPEYYTPAVYYAANNGICFGSFR